MRCFRGDSVRVAAKRVDGGALLVGELRRDVDLDGDEQVAEPAGDGRAAALARGTSCPIGVPAGIRRVTVESSVGTVTVAPSVASG